MKAFLKISGEGQNGRVPGWKQENAKHSDKYPGRAGTAGTPDAIKRMPEE